MLVVRNVSSIIVILLSVYALVTESFGLMPYMMFFLGVSTLMTGLIELRKYRQELQTSNHKFWGYMNVVVSMFVFFVALEGFLIS